MAGRQNNSICRLFDSDLQHHREAGSANILKRIKPTAKLYQPLCVTRVSISEKAGRPECKIDFSTCKHPSL